jgi:hypothetical protein
MLVKWAIGGLVVGAIGGLFLGDFIIAPIAGAIFAVLFRKWVVRTFWT